MEKLSGMTKSRARLLFGGMVFVALVGAGEVRGQEIFLAADAAGATRVINAPVGIPVTLFLLARPGALPGITGAEFLVSGLPAGWVAVPTPSPAATIALGSPFIAPGANIAFASCQAADVNGNVLLYTITIIATSVVPNVTLSVQARNPPTSPAFDCPLVTQCDAPAFTKTCVTAGAALLNPPLTTPVLGSPRSPGFVVLVGILALVGSLFLLKEHRRSDKGILRRHRERLRISLLATLPVLLTTYLAAPVPAQVISPGQSQCDVTFSQTFTGSFQNGQPYNYLTINPDGQGETFAGTGIGITVTLRDQAGQPVVGLPAQSIVLFNSGLCICPGGNSADAATDANGQTTFSGTIAGGGCVEGLDVYADGVFICSIPVNINSPDDAGSLSPCFTDTADLADFASRLGVPGNYRICSDYNESGPPTIDASDLAFFAAAFGAACPP